MSTVQAGRAHRQDGYQQEVKDYFARKAATYDLVDHQLYWQLSDELLWRVLTTRVLSNLPPDFRFLDAGGGTGRWTHRLLAAHPRCRGLLYDLSPEMAAEAVKKAGAAGHRDRLTVRNGDLDVVDESLSGQRFDLIISFHNVLGFVRDPEATITHLAGLLADDGWLVLFAPNRYHAAYFNLLHGDLAGATSSIRETQGRFVSDMPTIHLFTPARLRAAYAHSGLTVDLLTGFPVLVYPGFEETRTTGTSPRMSDLLADDDYFRAVLELENRVLTEEDVAARGNNLFIAGRRAG